MAGPHSMLPARKVMSRLLSCYYKQELVWSRKQRWGGVLVKIVSMKLNCAHTPQGYLLFVYSTLNQFVLSKLSLMWG